MKKKHIYPMPEALPVGAGSGKFKIGTLGKGQGGIRFGKPNQMMVPLDDDDHSTLIRAHEDTHALITPDNPDVLVAKHDISTMAFQKVEDRRVALYMEWAGIDLSAGYWPKAEVEGFAKDDAKAGFEQAVYNAFSMHGTGASDAYMHALTNEDTDLARKVMETVGQGHKLLTKNYSNSRPSFNDTVRTCKWLDQIVKIEEKKQEEEERQAQAPNKPTKQSQQQEQEVNQSVERLVREISRRSEFKPRPNDPLWGQLIHRKVPLPRVLPAKLRTIGRAPRNTGAVVRYISRYLTDQRIFAKNTPIHGGTVLFDVSGSMHLTSEQVLSVMAAAAGATIATYTGNSKQGWLTIVGQDQRYAKTDDIRPSGCPNNTIDGPALDWLGQQQEPRIWVSDGIVNGYSGQSGPEVIMDCATKVRKYHIMNAPDCATGVELLAKYTT